MLRPSLFYSACRRLFRFRNTVVRNGQDDGNPAEEYQLDSMKENADVANCRHTYRHLHGIIDRQYRRACGRKAMPREPSKPASKRKVLASPRAWLCLTTTNALLAACRYGTTEYVHYVLFQLPSAVLRHNCTQCCCRVVTLRRK